MKMMIPCVNGRDQHLYLRTQRFVLGQLTIAVMKPLRRALDRTTSKKPILNIPRKKVIMPT
jgi:hypothetical protein